MDFFNLLKSKRQTLIAFFIFFLVIGGAYTFTQDFKYGTKAKLLVIQENASGVDPFAVSRSVEYLSDLFSQVTTSNSFYNLVLNSNYNIEKDYFAGDTDQQMKKWRQTVSAKSIANTGMIEISVYHTSSYQAEQIAMAVADVLIKQNSNYQGIGSSVKITAIDEPVVSNYPVEPNLLINLLLVIIASLVFSLIYIYIFPEDKYNIHLFDKKAKKPKATTADFLAAAEIETQYSRPALNYQYNEKLVAPQAPANNAYHPESQGDIRNLFRG